MKREGGDPFIALMKLIAEKQKDLAQRFYSICDVLSHIFVLRMSLFALAAVKLPVDKFSAEHHNADSFHVIMMML